MQETKDILKTRQHYEILDGLRGIAALSIVVFHFMEVVYSDYSKNFIGHGFLAVDFFFCLSGFVIGYAYDDRIVKMGVLEFFKSRIIRLHPLVIIGSLFGLISFLFDPFVAHPETYSIGKLALIFLCSILLVPLPIMPERAFNLFSFNAPAWSLFWEYVANIFYAFILYRLHRRYLFIIAAVSAAAVCFVTYRSGVLIGGWNGDSFWDGCARISYSFVAGLIIYRSNWIVQTKFGFIGVAVLLVLTFVMPYSQWNWITEPIVVILVFPLLISLGAGARLSPKWKSLCSFSGKISYPLYMTHYSVLWMFANYFTIYKPTTTQLFFVISLSVIFLVSFAYLVMIVYDLPIRRYLTEKRKR